jgi:hypothetical protein
VRDLEYFDPKAERDRFKLIIKDLEFTFNESIARYESSSARWMLLRNVCWGMLALTASWAFYKGGKYGIIRWCMHSVRRLEHDLQGERLSSEDGEDLLGSQWVALRLITATTYYRT